MSAGRPSYVPWLVLALLVLAILVGWRVYEAREATAVEDARAERREARAERLEAHWSGVEAESRALIPPLLDGIYLGIGLEQARAARPEMEVPTDADAGEPGVRILEERFANGARAVYVFEEGTLRLQRLQVLSLLPDVAAIAPHLAAMNDQYGTPTGVWDCPDTGGVPTRRFTWRHGRTTVSDVFLLYRGRVSVTLYVAPTAIIARSLQRSACRPVPRDQLDAFPIVPDPSAATPSGGAPP